MFEAVQCFFGGHIWSGWQWNPELRLEHRDCTRCRKREAHDCQHEEQEMVFVKESERHSARKVGSAVCYQNYTDRTYRCPRCGGDVTQSKARDFMGPPVLEGQNVHLMAMRAGPGGSAGAMVAEFVQWSGGEIGFAQDRVSVFIGLKNDQITLDISSGQDENAPHFRDAPWSTNPLSIARLTIDLLCKYVVTHKAAASISPAKYRTLHSEASVPAKPMGERDDHIRGRTIMCLRFLIMRHG